MHLEITDLISCTPSRKNSFFRRRFLLLVFAPVLGGSMRVFG
jgi:hypothetical protein